MAIKAVQKGTKVSNLSILLDFPIGLVVLNLKRSNSSLKA